MSRFETANPSLPRRRRKRVESKVYIPTSRSYRWNEGLRRVRIRFSALRYRTSGQPPTSNYIYIYPGEDNPVLSALDSQRLCRLLEDLLFRSTSFLLPPPAPPLPRFPFTQTRRRVPTNYPPFSSSRKLVTRLYSSFPGESPARNNSRGMEG